MVRRRFHYFLAPAVAVLLAAVLIVKPVGATTDDLERRIALIIGNDTYAHLPALNNARKDAEDMAVKLRELGFETILKVNAGRRDMARALRDFEGRLSSGATGLAFFAGHGIQSDGKNYLIPVNANIEVDADLEVEALTAQDVLASMERAGNPLNIVILDACRDNPLPKRTRSARRGLTVVGIPSGAKGTAILYAAGEGQTAEDGPSGENGVFTGELLKVLDEPGLSLEQVFKQVNRRVQRRTSNRQRPWSLVSLQGDFVFRTQENIAVQSTKPSANINRNNPQTAEIVFWTSIKDSENPSDYEAYLSAFPGGLFVPLARNRIAKLGKSTNQEPALAVVPAPAPPPLPLETKKIPKNNLQSATRTLERAAWEALGNTPSIEALEAFLDQYGSSSYAEQARARLKDARFFMEPSKEPPG